MAKSNLTTTSNIQITAREVDFVTRFGRNWDAIREIMGVMRPIKKTPGTQLRAYKASVTLQSGTVGEGEEIPYSQAAVDPVAVSDIDLEKFAKAVSIEAVAKYGATVAVQKTDEAFLNELQGNVLTKFYGFAEGGTLRHVESTLQMAIAMAIGRVRDKFKKMHKDASEIVVFVNTLDWYNYLGSANITVQNREGMTYVENFMGARAVIMSSEIPEGMVIGIPSDNIVLYYIDPADGEIAQLGLNYTVQGETNLIGFHANGDYSHAVGESFALMGLTLWAEYIDAIAVEFVGTETTASAESLGTGDGSTKAFELDYTPVSITSVTVGGTATTAYSVDWANKKIIFDTAPAASAAVAATYKYAGAGA